MAERPGTDGTPPSMTAPETQGQVRLLMAFVFMAYLALMTLNPIIAPLSRAVAMPEWQLGMTISAAALMLVLTSQAWGRRSQSLGRRTVLLLALGLATSTMGGFALVGWLGMIGMVTGPALFALFLLLRGIGFGTAMAAILPTAQAYISDVTPDPELRVRRMSGFGAIQGLSMILGSVAGGLLAYFGLLTALIAVPILLAIGLILVATRLRREPAQALIDEPARVSPFDARVWPFLVAGFGLFTALGFIQIITGFLVQDRLQLDIRTSAVVNGGAMLTAGAALVAAQALVVPRINYSPARLIRTGALIAVGGFALLTADLGAIPLFLAIGLIGLGLGIATPGYVTGPTLAVSRPEFGSVSGLIGATNGLTFVIAPLASTALYGLWRPLPIAVGAVLMALVVGFTALHPRLRAPLDPTGAGPQSPLSR